MLKRTFIKRGLVERFLEKRKRLILGIF